MCLGGEDFASFSKGFHIFLSVFSVFSVLSTSIFHLRIDFYFCIF